MACAPIWVFDWWLAMEVAIFSGGMAPSIKMFLIFRSFITLYSIFLILLLLLLGRNSSLFPGLSFLTRPFYCVFQTGKIEFFLLNHRGKAPLISNFPMAFR